MTKALSRIELLKQRLKTEKEKKESGGTTYSSDIYPFWQMNMDESARVRILPDKNEDNPYMFYIDRLEHKLSINGEDKKIPCRQMYGEDCPICDLSRKYYKEEGKGSKNGKYYYRNKTSIVRVLVVDDPLDPNKETGETYEGKVLNTQFGFQLMEKIKEQISSDDLGDFTDFNEGYDFIIKKTKQGEYGTYSVGSQFARKPTAIDEDVQDAIELVDLSTLLPKDIGFEKVQNMLQAHLGGGDYEEEEEAPAPKKKAAKPVVEEDDEPAPAPKKKPKPVVEDEEEEEETPAPKKKPRVVVEEEEDEPVPAPKKKAPVVEEEEEEDEEDDIIAKIRKRKANAQR